MANPQKNESLRKFRTAVRWILIKLKLRNPKASYKKRGRTITLVESDREKTITEKKRLPNAGLNFSKIPILSETPKIQNPAAWVSSKAQKDTKPIRN